MLLVDHGKLVRAEHVSTGMPGLATPAGRFAVYMKSRTGGRPDTTSGCAMPASSLAATPFTACPVPAYPASHGCVRMSLPEAPFVYGFLRLGTPVFVFYRPQGRVSECPLAAGEVVSPPHLWPKGVHHGLASEAADAPPLRATGRPRGAGRARRLADRVSMLV